MNPNTNVDTHDMRDRPLPVPPSYDAIDLAIDNPGLWWQLSPTQQHEKFAAMVRKARMLRIERDNAWCQLAAQAAPAGHTDMGAGLSDNVIVSLPRASVDDLAMDALVEAVSDAAHDWQCDYKPVEADWKITVSRRQEVSP